MTVSIPVETTSHSCSEKPTVRTLDDLILPGSREVVLSKGLDVRDYANENVWRFSLDRPIKVPTFDVSNTHYKVGDIVIVGGHFHIITDKQPSGNTHQVAKEPEEYSNVETDISKFTSWTGRYFKTPLASSGANLHWTVGGRTYYLIWSAQKPGGCEKGHVWRIRDNTAPSGCQQGQNCQVVCHDPNMYSCLQHNHAWHYDPARDIKAEKKSWRATGGNSQTTLIFKSMVERGGNMYLRTWVDTPLEYKNVPNGTAYDYTLRGIYSPAEINGFRWNRKTNCGAAFDNKNYTKAEFSPSSGHVDFGMVTSEHSDTIAIGRVIGDSVTVTAVDETGTIISEISDYPIKNQLRDTQFSQASNIVLYTPTVLPPTTRILIRVKGGSVSVGRLLTGRMLKLGFTNTKFDNGFKDYSPKEQDQWGNIEYKNGIRVFIHNGTVDMPLKDYDELNLAFMYIGGQEMIINSSDSHLNTPPNSLDIFQATMMIGRFTSFKQSTKNAGAILDNIAGYTFAVEESV